MKEIKKVLNLIKKRGLYPQTPIVYSPHSPEIIIDNKKMLMFASNNYLGMLHDKRVIEAAKEGLDKWGIGNGGSRLSTGNLEIHNILENRVAEFKNKEASITFTTGYMANSGSIPAIVNVLKPSLLMTLFGEVKKSKDTIIFSDEYNHASIIAGIKMSGAPKEIYKHIDMHDLEANLKKYKKNDRKIIITDGVFSMDGDIAPLPDIINLARKYNCMTYLDDAHATGILGKHGGGLEDYYNITDNVDVVMGTFTKAFGGVGGFITGSNILIDYLKITANTYIFTAPIAPPITCGLIKSLEIIKEETWRREKIIKNSTYFREKLIDSGINICNSKTQIIPIFIGEEIKAVKVSQELLKRNIFIPATQWPAVPRGMARLRTTMTCMHTIEQIDYLIKNIKEIKNRIKF